MSRVVVGIRHPLQHLRGKAIRALRSEGLQVDVLGEDIQSKIIEVFSMTLQVLVTTLLSFAI